MLAKAKPILLIVAVVIGTLAALAMIAPESIKAKLRL